MEFIEIIIEQYTVFMYFVVVYVGTMIKIKKYLDSCNAVLYKIIHFYIRND